MFPSSAEETREEPYTGGRKRTHASAIEMCAAAAGETSTSCLSPLRTLV